MAEEENGQVTQPIAVGDDDVIGTPTTEDDVEIQMNGNVIGTLSTDMGVPVEDDVVRTDKQVFQLISWVEKERQKHGLATAHFESKAFWLMFLPITFLTLGSGTMSLYGARSFSETDESPSNARVEIGSINIDLVFVAGILSLFTTFFNALQDRLGFAGRAGMHKSASLQLNMLRFALDSLRVDDMITEDDRAHEIDKMEARFLEILCSCTSIMPTDINEAFELMGARTHAMYSRSSELHDIYKTPDVFLNKAANELGGAISSYRVCTRFLPLGFPLVLPLPDISVERALARLNKTIDDSNDRSAHGTHKSWTSIR